MSAEKFERLRRGVLQALSDHLVAVGTAATEEELERALSGLEDLPRKIRTELVPGKPKTPRDSIPPDMSGVGAQLEGASTRLRRISYSSVPAAMPEPAQAFRNATDTLKKT